MKAGARKSPLKRAELCPYARRRAISAGNAHLGHEGGQCSAGNAQLRHEGRQWSEDALRLERTAEFIWRKMPSFLSREGFPGGGIQRQTCRLLSTLLHASARSSLPPPSGGGKRLLVLPFSLSALQRGFSKRLQPSLSIVLPGGGAKMRVCRAKVLTILKDERSLPR